MVPEIKKILYSTDLSENSRSAFKYAAIIADRFGAVITILHVLEELPADARSRVMDYLGEERWNELQKQNEEQVLGTMKTRLEGFCKEITRELPGCSFVTDEIVVKTGHPVEEILGQAEITGCDLVVMGSHGAGILADAMMGSTARRVLRRCKKPVLVVRLPEGRVR